MKYGWQVPGDVAHLFAVHDGFGPILSNDSITVMAEVMDPICQQQNIYPEGYEYRDLIEFYPDGVGNAQCFYRHDGEVTRIRVVSFQASIDSSLSTCKATRMGRKVDTRKRVH